MASSTWATTTAATDSDSVWVQEPTSTGKAPQVTGQFRL